WQKSVLSLSFIDLIQHKYRDDPEALELLKSSYLLLLSDTTLTDDSRVFLSMCKPKNARWYYLSINYELTPEEKLARRRQHDGLNPENPLYLQLEKDLAWLISSDPERFRTALEQVAEIDLRFREADPEIQTSLRGQFQHGVSWTLREFV